MEKWKKIEKYPNYEVSNMGRVRNKETKEILRKTYNIVVINGMFRNVAVMVLEAFKNVSMHNRKVYYRDDDCSNCALSNISYKPFKKKMKKKPIVQLTVGGRYITSYPSIEDVKIGSHKKLSIALNDWEFRTYLGFRWLYLDEYANAVMFNSLHDSIKISGDIVQLTLEGDYINTYQCGGFKWMFKDDYMNEK